MIALGEGFQTGVNKSFRDLHGKNVYLRVHGISLVAYRTTQLTKGFGFHLPEN